MPSKTFFNLPDEKREKIISAALREFASRGFAKTSINSIVERAGIAKGSIYQYFADKKDFYLYLVRYVRDSYASRRSEAVGDFGERPLREVLRDLFLFFRDYREEHPLLVNFYFAMVGDGSIPFEAEIREILTEPSLEFVRELISTGIERGEIRGDIDREILTFELVALVTSFQGASVDENIGGYHGIDGGDRAKLAARADDLIERLFQGITPKTDSPDSGDSDSAG